MKKLLLFLMCLISVFQVSAQCPTPTSNYNFLGTFPRNCLPTSSITEGDYAIVDDNQRGMFVYNGVDWISLSGGEIDVMQFGAKGDGTTDDTAAIQAALDYAKLGKRGGIVVFPKPAAYYKVEGTLDLDLAQNVILQGSSMPNSVSAGLNGAIVFTGSGSTARISARSTVGVMLRNLRILYTNEGMTGYTVDFSRNPSYGDTHYPAVESCEFSGYGDGINAAAHLAFNMAIIGHVSGSFFGNAQIGIIGYTSGTYSNVFTIKDNTFLHNVVQHIRNGHTNWLIEANTFEPLLDGRAGGYDETIISYGPITIRNNYFGDVSTAGGFFINVKGHHFVIEGNLFANAAEPTAPNIKLNPYNYQIETVTLRNNVYTETKRSVLITGNSYVRRLIFDSEIFLPHGATPSLLTVQSGSLAPLSLEYRGMDYEGVQSRIPSLKTDAVNLQAVESLTPLTEQETGSIASMYTAFPYATLGIIGATRTDGIVNPISFFTGETTPTEKLRIDNNVLFKTRLLFDVDNTYDLGYSMTELRPRNGFFGNAISINNGTLLTTTNQTGTGNLVLATSPTIVTPTIGSGGTAINKVMSATASLNFSALAANTCENLTVSLSNAADGDVVSIGVPNSLASIANTQFSGFVSAANTVTIRRCNIGATTTSDPSAADVRVAITQF